MARVTFDFSGTTTVVTGGASGIGLACARAIAAAGGAVFISESRSVAKTRSALEEISSAGAATVGSAPCDVGDEASVTSFFTAAAAAFGTLDFVVHSAGISPNTEFFDQTQAEWDQVLNTNTTGAFLVTKYAAEQMKLQPLRGDIGGGSRGSILLITSTNGINSNDPVSAHYDSSKAAANMLVRNAAELLAPDHIGVNGLAPGWIDTELNATLPPDVREKESAKIWMNRWATPEEMAIAVMQMLTMPYCTGQVLLVDGGYR